MADSTDARGLIDDEGKLFGVVNVVDALVLLVLVAAVAGGAFVLLQDEQTAPPERATTNVTLDLGTQPTYVAAAISEGDSFSPTPDANVTVTAVHLAPADNRTQVRIGATVRGPTTDQGVRYLGAPLWLGRSLDLDGPAYNVTGRVSEIGPEATRTSNTTTVVVRQRRAPAAATELASGDTITVAGHTVGTVTDVAVSPTANATPATVLVEATVRSYGQSGTAYLGDTPLRAGERLTLPTADYTVDGRIERVGDGVHRGPLTNRTVTLAANGVREPVAAVVRPGLTERSGAGTTAYVTGVETTPSPVVGTTANGSVVTGDHPTLRDLALTTELRVSETTAGVRFRGEPLQHGSTVVLDLGTVTVETTVVEIGE